MAAWQVVTASTKEEHATYNLRARVSHAGKTNGLYVKVV